MPVNIFYKSTLHVLIRLECLHGMYILQSYRHECLYGIYEMNVCCMMYILLQSEEEQSRWKLVTLWIGGNDLCKHCSTSVCVIVDQYHT